MLRVIADVSVEYIVDIAKAEAMETMGETEKEFQFGHWRL
jgi:hypothetical protein